MKIKNKISGLTIALLIASMLIFGISITLVVQDSMTEDVVNNRLVNDRKVVDEFIRYTLNSYSDIELKRRSIEIAHKLNDMLGLRVSIYNDSILLADSFSIQEDMPDEVRLALKGDANYKYADEYVYFTFPLTSVANKYIGIVRLAYPTHRIKNVVARVQLSIIAFGIIILLGAVTVANYVAKRLSRPITELNEQVRKVKSGTYSIDLYEESNDEIGELMDSFSDMTKTIQENIEQLNLMIEKEKKSKEMHKSFVNNVTHEFKTPLTSIIGYSDLVSQYSDDPQLLQNAAKAIKSEGERLHIMVEKLLYLSSLERLDIGIKDEEINIKDLICEIIESTKIKARNSNITINCDFKWEGVIKGDYELLYSMLINIVDNGIKYNHTDGNISITVSAERNNTKLIIKDTGIGISQEEIEKIYEPFYRVDKNRSRKIGGSGLGLSIVKEIVTLHKGRIYIKSEINKGTEVIIYLPIY